jgi:hypothetical protein
MNQECLIFGTIPIEKEEFLINQLLDKGSNHTNIILYGKNGTDSSTIKKRKQLIQLGFDHVFIYVGGLFEWLLLQDIYGSSEFPTTNPCKDLLAFRETPIFTNIKQITF